MFNVFHHKSYMIKMKINFLLKMPLQVGVHFKIFLKGKKCLNS